MALVFKFDASRPIVPGVGRSIPLNTHGHVVYLTNLEHHRMVTLMVVSPILFAIGMAFELVVKLSSGEQP